MNLPNKLTIARIIMIPVFLVFLLTNCAGDASKYIAAAVFAVASITDFVDGKIARKNNLVTTFGKFMDPLADKLLVCSALIAFTGIGYISSWIVIVIIGRDFIINAFRLVAASSGVVIAADYWGKFKTASQMIMVVLLILQLDFPYMDYIETAFVYLSLVLTVVSLIDCLYKNRRILFDGSDL